MKYLKSYKVFESNSQQNLFDLLNDLSHDLRDDGFDVIVKIDGFDVALTIKSINAIPSPWIEFQPIKEFVKRLESFGITKDKEYVVFPEQDQKSLSFYFNEEYN